MRKLPALAGSEEYGACGDAAAKMLEFEHAAILRDRIIELRGKRSMRYAWLDEYLLSLPGAEKDYQPEWGWFRYLLRGKMFAAVCSPGPEHRLYGGHDLVNLKCDPRRAELLRAQHPDILPGFYSNKRTWIACFLDGSLPDDLLRQLCADSHCLVLEKLPKYVQREILNACRGGTDAGR